MGQNIGDGYRSVYKIFFIFTYWAFHFEHVAIVFGSFDVPCDVSEESEIVGILTRTKYVPNLMVTDHFLKWYQSEIITFRRYESIKTVLFLFSLLLSYMSLVTRKPGSATVTGQSLEILDLASI